MIQAKPSPGRLAERFTVCCRGRLIRRTNAVGPQATLNGHKIKINVTSVNKTAGIIRRLCTLPGTSEILTVATDRPLLSMPDVIAPLLSVDEGAVLLWSEVTLSSQLIVARACRDRVESSCSDDSCERFATSISCPSSVRIVGSLAAVLHACNVGSTTVASWVLPEASSPLGLCSFIHRVLRL
jgi:hypothetical protein